LGGQNSTPIATAPSQRHGDGQAHRGLRFSRIFAGEKWTHTQGRLSLLNNQALFLGGSFNFGQPLQQGGLIFQPSSKGG
jgi:hypothetical protein